MFTSAQVDVVLSFEYKLYLDRRDRCLHDYNRQGTESSILSMSYSYLIIKGVPTESRTCGMEEGQKLARAACLYIITVHHGKGPNPHRMIFSSRDDGVTESTGNWKQSWSFSSAPKYQGIHF